MALALIAIAFTLRIYLLPDLPPGLNGDVAWNLMDVMDIRDTGEIPLYFTSNFGREPLFIYMQGLMSAIVGITPFGAKLTSAFIGTVTVALLYRLARSILGQGSWAPLVSAAVLTFTLHHVLLSRVGFRAISLAPLAIASLIFLWDAYRSGRWRSFLLSGLFLGLALQTYLAARLLPLIPAIMLAVALLRRWPLPLGLWRKGLGAGLVAAVVALPLITLVFQDSSILLRRTETVAVSPLIAIRENAGAVAGMFFLKGDGNINHNLPGRPVYDPALGTIFLAGLLVTIATTITPLRHRLRLPEEWELPAVMALSWLVVMLIPTLLSDGAPHFLRSLGAAPAAALVSGFGAEALRVRLPRERQWLGTGALGVLLLIGATITTKDFFGGWGQHPELGQAFGVHTFALADHLRPRLLDHPIGLDAPVAEHGTFRFMLRDSLRGLPAPLPIDLKHVFVERNRAGVYPSDMEYIYFGPHSQREHLPPWLQNPTMSPLNPLGKVFSFKLPNSLSSLDLAFRQPLLAEATFAKTLALTEASLPQEPPVPGQAFPVVLKWRVLQPPSTEYHLSIRALDAARRPWGFLDERLGDGFPPLPTTEWRVGDTVYTAHFLKLAADGPPGTYSLAVTVFSFYPLQNLAVETPAGPRGDILDVGDIMVDAPSAEAFGAMRPETRLDHSWDGLTLFGYGFSSPSTQAGEGIDIHLFWRVDALSDATAIRLEVEDAGGNKVATVEGPPLAEMYPFTRWRSGDAFHDIHRLPIGAQAASGRSRLTITLVGSDGSPLVPALKVPGPDIRSRPRLFEVPAGLKQVGVEIGGLARLEGFAAPEPPTTGTWPVSLAWRALREGDRSYAVTVQLVDDAGRLLAQHDGFPAGGTALTSSWLTGEVVVDQHQLILPGLTAGRYSLIAALYDPSGGRRLPVGDSDHVVLERYEVP